MVPGLCKNGKCISVPSSYRCMCNLGFKLSSDGKRCDGKMEFDLAYIFFLISSLLFFFFFSFFAFPPLTSFPFSTLFNLSFLFSILLSFFLFFNLFSVFLSSTCYLSFNSSPKKDLFKLFYQDISKTPDACYRWHWKKIHFLNTFLYFSGSLVE